VPTQSHVPKQEPPWALQLHFLALINDLAEVRGLKAFYLTKGCADKSGVDVGAVCEIVLVDGVQVHFEAQLSPCSRDREELTSST
jgi:hypothetical protein